MTLSRTTYKILIYVLPVVLVALGFILLYEILPALAQQTPAQADVDAARRLAADAARATETQNTFIARVLWWVVATVFGGLTWVAGGLLDWSITTLVLNFGTIFQNSGLGVAVNQLWAVVRDIFNLTFIFGLVYIGFRLVVNAESSTARKAIVSLIIAALLVNFSLFITKTVIDFSNIAAVQISQLIYSGNLPTSNSTSSISLAFGNQMGLASLWGQSEAEVQRNTIANNRNTAPSGGLLYIFGAMILFLIAAFAFIVGAVLLISRFIALNFMMILSPVMFLGFVFAPLQSLSSQYWSKFLNQCFFAPAFLLMIYFSLYILGTFTSIVRQQGSTIANTLENGTNISSIAGFLLGGGFLLASVMIAQKMGAHGASTAMKIGGSFVNKARSVAINAALAAPRAAGRFAAGKAAKYGEKANNAMQRTKVGRGFKIAASIASLGAFTERERLAAIDAGKKAKFGGSRSWQDDRDFKDKLNIRTNNLAAEAERNKNHDAHVAMLKNDKATATELTAALKGLADTMKQMAQDEKKDLGLEKLQNQTYAVNLTDSDIEHIEKSGKYAHGDIGKIKEARKKGYLAIATTGSTIPASSKNPNKTDPVLINAQRAGLFTKGTDAIAKLPAEIFSHKEMMKYLTPRVLETRMRALDLTNDQVEEIRSSLKLWLKNTAAHDPANPLIAQWGTWSHNTNNVFAQQLGKIF